MPQGFKLNRHKVNGDEQERWAFFGHTINEDPLPDHPEILPLVIRALSERLRRMHRSNCRGLNSHVTESASSNVDRMRDVVRALLNRIEQLDRTRNKDLARRIGIYVAVIAQRCRWPGELEINWLYKKGVGHYDLLFDEELKYIEKERLTAFSCIPAVLRLQRDFLYECLNRRRSLKCPNCGTLLVKDRHRFRCDKCDWEGHIALEGYTDSDTPRTWLIRNQSLIYKELTFYPCACRYQPNLSLVDIDQTGPGELIPAILAGLHKGSTAASIRQSLKKSARQSKVPPFLA